MTNLRRTVPFIRHAETEDVSDDPEHPIPALGVIDVHAVRVDGGSDLVIVIASPLQADTRSKARLLVKLEGYLAFIESPEYTAQAGPPSLESTCIHVAIHEDSHPEVFEVLEQCRTWVAQHRTSFRVKRDDGRFQDVL